MIIQEIRIRFKGEPLRAVPPETTVKDLIKSILDNNQFSSITLLGLMGRDSLKFGKLGKYYGLNTAEDREHKER